jgi:hypothetical protein
MNNNLNNPLEKTTCKEKAYNECKCNLQFFGGHGSLQKNNVHQKDFVKKLSLLLIKNHLLI